MARIASSRSLYGQTILAVVMLPALANLLTLLFRVNDFLNLKNTPSLIQMLNRSY